MDAQTASELLEINRRFYNEFGDAFAATRRRIQPGVMRILETIPKDPPSDWLDLGCGSGMLGQIWAEQGYSGSYTGLDFSGPLLQEAENLTSGLSTASLVLHYVPGDLMDPHWDTPIRNRQFDGILAFASLHHIPGKENRLRIFCRVWSMLKSGGRFIFSVWQFQNSPKLVERIQPWDQVGLSADRLETGDTLLDWRYALQENDAKVGLRYVHLFCETELDELAQSSGFTVEDRFYSDGTGGNLALYTCLRKKVESGKPRAENEVPV